jgi:hypothetical protein
MGRSARGELTAPRAVAIRQPLFGCLDRKRLLLKTAVCPALVFSEVADHMMLGTHGKVVRLLPRARARHAAAVLTRRGWLFGARAEMPDVLGLQRAAAWVLHHAARVLPCLRAAAGVPAARGLRRGEDRRSIDRSATAAGGGGRCCHHAPLSAERARRYIRP